MVSAVCEGVWDDGQERSASDEKGDKRVGGPWPKKCLLFGEF